jgi:hypothetical protein
LVFFARHGTFFLEELSLPSSLKNLTFAGTLIALAALAAAPASALPITNEIYDFTGACTDCYSGEGNATAELTLTGDYVLGQSITTSNFVSFNYDGTDLLSPYTIAAGDASLFVSGSLSTVPGFDTVSFSSVNGIFLSSSSGSWCTGVGLCESDQGTNGSYSSAATPEPGTAGLLGAGLVALGMLSRRARKL